MRNMKAAVVASLLGLLPAMTAWAGSDVLTPYHADYSLARNGMTLGTASFSLQRDDDGNYIYKSVSHATGLASLFAGDVITQMSKFGLADGQPQPLLYSYSQSGGKHEKSESIQFDWAKKLAHGDEDGRQHKNPLRPGISDVFLIQLMLAVDAADGKLAKEYTLLDHGETTDYTPQKMPDQRMRVDKTQVDTLVLELHDAKKGRVIGLWLAPALHYLPVQIQQSEPGKATFTLSLDSISFDKTEAPTAASAGK